MRVWIARAEPSASRTAARLRALGHEPLVAPILTIVPRPGPPPDGPFDAVLLTSANAAAAPALAGFRDVPVYAVGRRTAVAARGAGFATVAEAGGDASALAALIRQRLEPGAALLHAAGEDRKPEPSRTLLAAGYRLKSWTAYAAQPATALPPGVAQALTETAEARLACVLHYSRRSAGIALALAERAGLGPEFRMLRQLCLSPDVTVPLVEAGITAHFVPARPDEASLLAGLDPSRPPPALAGDRVRGTPVDGAGPAAGGSGPVGRE